jgi:hypothetical protein
MRLCRLLAHHGSPGMRIAGFNHRGEARIVNDEGITVAVGRLELANAHLTGIETGDRFPLEVVITWMPELPDPDDDLDWDALLRD